MSRSTLTNHSFPPFYACYLLKSVKTPKATACVTIHFSIQAEMTFIPQYLYRQHAKSTASHTVGAYTWALHRVLDVSSCHSQHNGEITAGAFKTIRSRPWVMQMIVHGFPSRLAALQFEWAWQHPHRSRHLRDKAGNSLFPKVNRTMKSNILYGNLCLCIVQRY